MNFVSTRGKAPTIGIRAAIEAGLAPDGGLYVPEKMPVLPSLPEPSKDPVKGVAAFGAAVLAPFFADDPSLSRALPGICREAFNFPVPLTPVSSRKGDCILELFHGPTAAFKDFGARFLAGCIESIDHDPATARPPGGRTVVVATSGDTGGAVAAAFHGREGTRVAILFPKGKISPRQEAQLCAWGGNIRAFAVEGVFDDCQRIAKEALLEAPSQRLSANSINLGRILPQMVYHAHTSLLIQKATGKHANLIIPTGNLGNSLAALWAKKIGFPIGKVVLALNANFSVSRFLKTGVFTADPTLATLANAMDVGNPSNLERLRFLYPVMDTLRADVSADSVTDEEIRSEIRTSEREWGQALCPHTATAAVLRKRLPAGTDPWVLVATAHPAKFESIVEPLVGHAIEVPAALAAILSRPATCEAIAPTFAAFKARLIL
jgi:threonine synthase